MTLPTTSPTISYAGDGVSTVFSVPFVFYGPDELAVYETDLTTTTQLTRGVHYNVSGGLGLTGNIAAIAPASGTILTIRRETTRQQTVNYTNSDPFDADTTETVLDRLAAMLQEDAEALGRTLRVPPREPVLDMLPGVATRIGAGDGSLLGFNSLGEPVVYPVDTGVLNPLITQDVDGNVTINPSAGKLTNVPQLNTTGAISDGSVVTVVPISGQSITIPDGTSWYNIKPAGTLASLTVTMPAAPRQNQVLLINTTEQLTTFTLSANSGQTIQDPPTTFDADRATAWRYSGTSWQRADSMGGGAGAGILMESGSATKISAMSLAATPSSADIYVPIIQGGVNKKRTIGQLLISPDATGAGVDGTNISILTGFGLGVGSGGAIAIVSGEGGTAGHGGDITITPGDGGLRGGDLFLNSGASGSGGGRAGNIEMLAGTSTDDYGGSILLTPGSGAIQDGDIVMALATSAPLTTQALWNRSGLVAISGGTYPVLPPSAVTAGGMLWNDSTASLATTALMLRYAPIVGGGTVTAPHTIASNGTSGHALISAGGTADPAFGLLALTALATQGAGTVLANVTGGSASPTAATPSAVLDLVGSTRGGHLYRGASGWAVLNPGSINLPLVSAGAGADPAYAVLTVPGGGTGITSGTGTGILYFANSTTIASSPALTGNSLMLASSTGAKTVVGFTTDGLSTITIGGVTSSRGQINLGGNSSGTVSITVAAAAGTYNFNLPTSAGSSGQPLLSGGGGSTAMTFGALALTALAAQAAGTVVANVTGGSATPTAATPSSVIDLIGSTRGSVLYRGSGGWAALTPGTSGLPLLSAGAGADPAYGALDISTAAVTGTLAVAKGGTGITNAAPVMITFPLDGGGLAITSGYKSGQFIDFAGSVSKWSLFWYDANDQGVSDTGAIDVICDAYASFGTRTSMVGAGTKPNTSAASKAQAAPASWTTTAIASGSFIAPNVTTAPATAVRGTLTLTVSRT